MCSYKGYTNFEINLKGGKYSTLMEKYIFVTTCRFGINFFRFYVSFSLLSFPCFYKVVGLYSGIAFFTANGQMSMIYPFLNPCAILWAPIKKYRTSSNRSQALYGGPRSDTNPAKAMPSNTLVRKSFSIRPRWPRKAAYQGKRRSTIKEKSWHLLKFPFKSAAKFNSNVAERFV